MNRIHEFYFSICKDFNLITDAYTQALEKNSEYEAYFEAQLIGEQKENFRELINEMDIVSGELMVLYFEEGFKQGAMVMIEVYKNIENKGGKENV